jgi:hypothetical protein
MQECGLPEFAGAGAGVDWGAGGGVTGLGAAGSGGANQSSQQVVLLLQSDVMMLQSHNLRLAGMFFCY